MEKLNIVSFRNRPYHVDCVQWNEDGQLALCLDAHVHIITPLIVGLNSKEDSYKHIGFSKPAPEPELKATVIANGDDVQTSFLNEEGYRCANWSQTGLSVSQSCLLVVVTTKHRVLLYQGSTKNPLDNDWQLFVNITDKIKEAAIDHNYATKINPHHTLYAQWSKKIIVTPMASKPCLLALTNKAGDLCFWNLTSTTVEHLDTITPHKSFVNLVQWSNWKKGVEPNTYLAFTVSSSTNGTVALSSVLVKISVDEHLITTVEDILVSVIHMWFEEGSAVTTLIKVQDDFEQEASHLRIALSKGINVSFISLTVDGNAVHLEKEWVSYCLQHSGLGLAGGSWLSDFDFRCYTMEGEGMQFHFSAEDMLVLDEKEQAIISTKLVQKYKYQWMEEQAKTEEDDIISASDALPYIFGACDSLKHMYTAVFFTMRPTVDVHYRVESLEEANLTFILQKPRASEIYSLLKDIDTYVNNPNFCNFHFILVFLKPVKGLIREILDYLIEDDNILPIKMWYEKLVECMASGPTLVGNQDLTKSIYCESSTIASRIILNAELEMKNYRLIAYESEFTQICAAAKEKTTTHFLFYIFYFALQLPDERFGQFSSDDRNVLLLLCDYALYLGINQLREQCMDIYMKLQEKCKMDLYPEIAYCSSPDGPFSLVSREKCHVCDEPVSAIGDSNLAQCAAGHFWVLQEKSCIPHTRENVLIVVQKVYNRVMITL
ncbi:transcription factor IIIC subunit delta N-term-domain-containing protein [Thamnidium elegans]|nr:transcription factor IIIC subunit delta N-term-domain-containing protein [Thamnidium elegans]